MDPPAVLRVRVNLVEADPLAACSFVSHLFVNKHLKISIIVQVGLCVCFNFSQGNSCDIIQVSVADFGSRFAHRFAKALFCLNRSSQRTHRWLTVTGVCFYSCLFLLSLTRGFMYEHYQHDTGDCSMARPFR